MFKQHSDLVKLNLGMSDSLADRLRFEVEQTLKKLYADKVLVNRLEHLYLPFANWLSYKSKVDNGPLIVGLGGAQGCGKTTFSHVVSRILMKGFGLNCAVVSLDDLYSTRVDRLQFAQKVSPIFATRGVPGTHDIDLAINLFNRLKNLKKGEVMRLPCFDKSLDERKPVHLWQEISGPIDVLLFEGWCVGAPPMDGRLDNPINALEEVQDKQGIWRNKVNELLANEYQQLFANIDIMVWMQAPNYEVVYQWRNKQERLLEAHLNDIHGVLLDTIDLKVMTPEALKVFMEHYERLTKHMLNVMPERSDVLFRLSEDQDIMEVQFPVEH